MKNLVKKLLALGIVFAFLLSFAACNNVKEETPEPTVTVLNEVSCRDNDPSLLIKGEGVTFSAFLKKEHLSLSGAFRNLAVRELMAIDDSTLMVTTEGSVYAEDMLGYVGIPKDYNSLGTQLVAEANIDRSTYGSDLVRAGFFVDLGLGLLKGIAVTGAEKAFGYGLDKMLYEKLGLDITTLTSLRRAVEELSSKIDALSNQMKEMEANLTDLINESTEKVLTNEYLNTFEEVHSLITSVRTETVNLWKNIATIEATADETSEEYRTLVIAELLTFSELEGKSVSQLVTDVEKAITYIDGSYFSLNPEGLYYRVFKVGCTRSVFGGEAAILMSEYLNTLNAIVSEALNAMIIVCQAKYFTYRQLNVTPDKPEYKDVISFADGKAVETKEQMVNLETLAEKDRDLKNRLTSGLIAKYGDKANGSVWKDELAKFAGYATDLFDEKNPDSVLSQYNTYVVNHAQAYNKSYTVSGEFIDVDFVNLRTAISCTGSSECGLRSSGGWTDSTYRNGVKNVNDTVNYYLSQCMTAEELETFFLRLMSNESGLLFGKADEEKTYTVSDVLRRYGFTVSDVDGMPTYYGVENTTDDGQSKLYLTGYPAGNSVTVSRSGEMTASSVKAEKLNYFDYNKSWEETRFYFYYFTEESLIYTVDDLVDFLIDVADGHADACAKLMADLDVSGVDWAKVWPKAKANSEFRGTFNGNGHTLSNLTYDEGENGGCPFGLFRTVGQDAVIKNLTFENVAVNCENSDSVGVCAGSVNAAATLTGIQVTGGRIRGGSNVGGIIGNCAYPNTTANCSNAAKVEGTNYVGGIIGNCSSGGTPVFSSCTNLGEIIASRGSAGGMTAYLNAAGTFKKCVNEGNVRGYSNAGGLAGGTGSEIATFKITDSVNRGDVLSETQNAGGLVGIMRGQKVTLASSQNHGAITGSVSAGGLLGTFNNSRRLIGVNSFGTSENHGSVTAKKYAGGLVGYGYYFYCLEIIQCPNSGNVTASERSAGGLIGETAEFFKTKITESDNSGTVSGKRYTGNTVGYDSYNGTHTY